MIPPRAYRHHLPLCPACLAAVWLGSLGVVLAVGRVQGLLFGVSL